MGWCGGGGGDAEVITESTHAGGGDKGITLDCSNLMGSAGGCGSRQRGRQVFVGGLRGPQGAWPRHNAAASVTALTVDNTMTALGEGSTSLEITAPQAPTPPSSS